MQLLHNFKAQKSLFIPSITQKNQKFRYTTQLYYNKNDKEKRRTKLSFGIT